MKKLALWRKQLTLDLAQHRPELTSEQLDITANQILERLLLCRISEEQGIITDRQLLQLIQQPNIYQNWCRWLESGRVLIGLVSNQRQPGELQPKVSDDFLKLLIQYLYNLEDLATIPLEILGQCYEQLLTKNQVAQNRSSYRKKAGIYYTPAAIVQDIIDNTLGQKLRGQTLETMEQSPLRIIDPACGAGSFLSCAYRVLLEWYRSQYVSDLAQHQTYLYQTRFGYWALRIETKQRILLQHIYGVDIDVKAVELTKQLLLVLMLTDRVKQRQIGQATNDIVSLSLLDRNIFCGDALIGSDFEQITAIKQHNICQFDWHIAFPQVMQLGGFDVVIGNPPWVFTRNAQFDDQVKQYYQSKYLAQLETTQVGKTKQAGKINLFTLFLLLFIRLLHPQGLMGILVPNTLLRTTLHDTVRKYILDYCRIEQIVDLGGENFSGITAALIVLILSKESTSSHTKIRDGIIGTSSCKTINQQLFLDNTSYIFSILLNDAQIQLFNKIEAISLPLYEFAQTLIEGIVCRRDQIFKSQPNCKYQKLLEGKDIQRYSIIFRDKYILFDRSQIHRPRPNYVWEAKEKIILRRIGGGQFSLVAALDTENYYTFASTNNLLLRVDCAHNVRYVLALINSKLLNYYYAQKFTNRSRLTVNISKTFTQQLPICTIDFGDKSDRERYNRLIELVDLMQLLNKKLVSSTAIDQHQTIQTQIDQIDQQINQTVYALYQLTDAEVEMVETNQ